MCFNKREENVYMNKNIIICRL
ncbi:hypothetical protein CNEO3_320031 [Clostridium neonatale]|nr:hypothetical protein CNEO3_320031 [Clostridium neonatale]